MPLTKDLRRLKIKRKIRRNMSGTAEKPRLSVFRSNKQIYAQLIDDATGVTLLGVSSLDKEIVAGEGSAAKCEQAKLVGLLVAKKSIEKGITEVVFDRNGYLYHGRVKNLADAAREGGLKF